VVGALPGTLEWVSTDVDGIEVGGWLCLPAQASAAQPAPVMLWIHGGPHGSYNAWSWRWCPWFAVEAGYAVLMPDPAMSTGYGDAGLNRGWPRRPDIVFHECETLLDAVLERAELDGSRTAMLGASFGGFMANWIAGHTDRFDAIVSHAGLWALPQQHRTTDAAASKMRVHGHEDEDPDWYRAFSPHHEIDAITTPMLVTHGNRDYRVPISEALRLWWDLVSAWDGAPEDMPHRFLQVTSENHWVLTPSNAVVWNRAVLAFCDQHVLGGPSADEAITW
jgi:dipeptidyl aminopeptidase/acylaminoacyl peptidase